MRNIRMYWVLRVCCKYVNCMQNERKTDRENDGLATLT